MSGRAQLVYFPLHKLDSLTNCIEGSVLNLRAMELLDEKQPHRSIALGNKGKSDSLLDPA